MHRFFLAIAILTALLSCSTKKQNKLTENIKELPQTDHRSQNIQNPIMHINGKDYETNVEVLIFDVEKLDLSISFDSNLSQKSAKYSSGNSQLSAKEVNERFDGDKLLLTLKLKDIKASEDPTQKFVIHTVSEKNKEKIQNDYIVIMTRYKQNTSGLQGIIPPKIFVDREEVLTLNPPAYGRDSIDIIIEFDRSPIRRVSTSTGKVDVEGSEHLITLSRKGLEDRIPIIVEWGFKGNLKQQIYTFTLKDPFPFGKVNLSDISVSCRGSESCPNNVGVLLSKLEGRTITCTAFLIEPNIIATSGRCFGIETCKDDCAKLTQVKFGPANFNCIKVDKVVDHSVNYAFCTLDRVVALKNYKDNFVRLPQDTNSIYTWNMDALVGTASSFIQKKRTCEILSGHYPFYTRSNDDAYITTSCDFIVGNIGSPVFNTDGKILGMMFAGDDRTKNFNWRASKGKNSTAINSKCICLPGEPCNLEDFCYKGSLDRLKRQAEFLETKINKAELEMYLSHISSRPIDIDQKLFVLETNADSIKIGFKPDCIYKNEFTNSIQIALCNARLEMDDQLKVTSVKIFPGYCKDYTLNQIHFTNPKFSNYTTTSATNAWALSPDAIGTHGWEFCPEKD